MYQHVSRLRALPQAKQPKSIVFSTRPETESKSQRRPLIIDSLSPCYVLDIDPEEEEGVFTVTTIPPAPKKGIKVYLEQLATTMGLPAVKPNIGLKSDSISVQFLIFKNGWIAALTSHRTKYPFPWPRSHTTCNKKKRLRLEARRAGRKPEGIPTKNGVLLQQG